MCNLYKLRQVDSAYVIATLVCVCVCVSRAQLIRYTDHHGRSMGEAMFHVEEEAIKLPSCFAPKCIETCVLLIVARPQEDLEESIRGLKNNPSTKHVE